MNVDLELGARTRAQLAALIEALDGKLFELFRGRIGGLYRAHYESSGCHADASATIRALVTVIDALPARARRAWKAASLRDFNIGVELAPRVRSVELAIAPDVLRHVAAVDGRIAFTAYRSLRSSQRRRAP